MLDTLIIKHLHDFVVYSMCIYDYNVNAKNAQRSILYTRSWILRFVFFFSYTITDARLKIVNFVEKCKYGTSKIEKKKNVFTLSLVRTHEYLFTRLTYILCTLYL